MNQSLENQVVQLPWHWRNDPSFLLSEWEVKITRKPVVPAREPGIILAQWGDEAKLWVTEDEHHFRAWRPRFSLSLDLLNQKGEAQILTPRDHENLQRFLYFFSFLACDSLLLHASSLVRRGRAFVFPGVSGAGKTTIVRHSPGMPVLSDEISAVRLSPEDQPVRAYGTPFYGDWGQPGERLSAPLRGLYFPVKHETNRVTPITPQETLKRLLPCVCAYTTWKPRLKKLVDLTVRLSERIPAYLLYFRLDPSLWEAIDAS